MLLLNNDPKVNPVIMGHGPTAPSGKTVSVITSSYGSIGTGYCAAADTASPLRGVFLSCQILFVTFGVQKMSISIFQKCPISGQD